MYRRDKEVKGRGTHCHVGFLNVAHQWITVWQFSIFTPLALLLHKSQCATDTGGLLAHRISIDFLRYLRIIGGDPEKENHLRFWQLINQASGLCYTYPDAHVVCGWLIIATFFSEFDYQSSIITSPERLFAAGLNLGKQTPEVPSRHSRQREQEVSTLTLVFPRWAYIDPLLCHAENMLDENCKLNPEFVNAMRLSL